MNQHNLIIPKAILENSKYLYIDYMNNKHYINRNEAILKLQRDAVICLVENGTVHLADCASAYAEIMLADD